jgi:FemAB-related protein (PEP-CTERM system-associated)
MDSPEAVSITTASPRDAHPWDAFVGTHAQASGYHAWGWRTVFERAFKHEPIYLIARRGADMVGVLPLVAIRSVLFGRTLTSLPFVNYGGVVASDDRIAQALVDASRDLARDLGCGHVELRHTDRRFAALPCKQHKVAMRLALDSVSWERLDKKVRNQIRKAEKSGLTAHSGGAELLDEFYRVFARNMRDLGTPVYARTMFEEVLRVFPGQAHVHVIRLQGIAVGAAVTYRTGGVMEMPWASSVRDYNVLCPNHLLYWTIIQFAAARGQRVLDFGRSTPGEGTFKFKEQWGARPLALHWEYVLAEGAPMPDVSPANPKFQAAIEIWKRLPLPLATRIGPHVVRGIP